MLFGSRREAWHDVLARMTQTRFEALLVEHFRAEGWSVERAGAPHAARMHDGAIDLALRRGDGQFAIAHCKRWNAYQVPPADVERLAEAMQSEHATGAIFVTCGEFSRAAIRAAKRHRGVTLVDGAIARSWLLPPPSTALARTDPMRTAPDRHRAPRRKRSATRWVVGAVSGALVATAALVPFVPALADRVAAVLHWARIPDPMRRVDHDRARAAAMRLHGVQSAFWLDGDDFMVMVAGRGRRTMATIDAVCRALEPLGDTLGVVVNVQDVTATRAQDTKTLSRNCRLPEGERATFQWKRAIDIDWRHVDDARSDSVLSLRLRVAGLAAGRRARRTPSRPPRTVGALALRCGLQRAQLVLRAFEYRAAPPTECAACTVDVEREHRHRGAERLALSAPAAPRRLQQGTRDRGRVVEREHAFAQVQGTARVRDAAGPARLALGRPLRASLRRRCSCAGHGCCLCGGRRLP